MLVFPNFYKNVQFIIVFYMHIPDLSCCHLKAFLQLYWRNLIKSDLPILSCKYKTINVPILFSWNMYSLYKPNHNFIFYYFPSDYLIFNLPIKTNLNMQFGIEVSCIF